MESKVIRILILLFFITSYYFSGAKNPIIPNRGANDPHIRIIDGKTYLSASHDKSIESNKFIREDWWPCSSDDLVNWKLVSVLKPDDKYIGKPFDGCWATDIVKRNGKWFWYFSERNEQSGIDEGDFLVFPNIKGLDQKSKIEMNLSIVKKSTVEICDGSPSGKKLALYKMKKLEKNSNINFEITTLKNTRDLCFVFKGKGDELVQFNWFGLK